MADAPTFAQVMANVVPVVIGGLLAVGGGAVTQWYLHGLKSGEEKRARKAGKLEELLGALFEHKHWIEAARNIRVFGVAGVVGSSPMSKIQAVTAAYFPQFEDQVCALDIAADKFELWMLEAEHRRKNEAFLPEDHDAASRPYLEHFHDLLDGLRKYAKSELQ